MEIVRIKCFDMSYNTGLWDRSSIKHGFGLVNLDTVGWLIEEKEDCIIIASEYQPENEQFRHLMAVPKVCITEMKKFRKK